MDKRTDIWAFGCVLYRNADRQRLLRGRGCGEHAGLRPDKEPDWGALTPTTPSAIRGLIRRCLDKDRRKRIADISTALFVIDEAGPFGTAQPALSPPIAVRAGPRGVTGRDLLCRRALVVAAIAGGGVLVGHAPGGAPRLLARDHGFGRWLR